MTDRIVPTGTVLPLPAPPGHRLFGHLPRWMFDSLGLLQEGGSTGPLFRLRLWRTAIVGSTPDWNRFVLGDTNAFRSKGSLSQLSPYLSAGIVATDAPLHRQRRKSLNPVFHRAAVVPAFGEQLAAEAQKHLPIGEFNLYEWSSRLVQTFINSVFFDNTFPPAVLQSFLAPLDRVMPFPLLARPLRIRTMHRHLTAWLADVPARSPANEATGQALAARFRDFEDGVAELRVAIAAAYDTTAHTLAFALWELAGRPDLNDGHHTSHIVSETLRLYPAGWIGSRVSAENTVFEGHRIAAGQLVLYSPYLTHRNPELWSDPSNFEPDRFDRPLPAWGYIPYSAGERTCLGAALATLMLQTAIAAFAGSTLERVTDAAPPTGGLTLTPDKNIRLRRTAS